MAVALTAPADQGLATTRTLLAIGMLAGPAFAVSAVLQMLTRGGFDLTRHPISLLSTGEQGWIQIATFVTAGLGVVALAIGIQRVDGSRWTPRLVAMFGIGLIVAGLFTADPEDGFPVGTPAGPAESMSWHGIVHTSAAVCAFLALAAATIIATVLAVRRHRVGAALGHGLVSLVLLMPTTPDHASVQLALTGAVAFLWTTVVAHRVRVAAR